MHEELREQNARDLANAERLGVDQGKEPFSWAELRKLAGIEGNSPEREQHHKFHYYTSEYDTLEDYARFLCEMEPWSDSN